VQKIQPKALQNFILSVPHRITIIFSQYVTTQHRQPSNNRQGQGSQTDASNVTPRVSNHVICSLRIIEIQSLHWSFWIYFNSIQIQSFWSRPMGRRPCRMTRLTPQMQTPFWPRCHPPGLRLWEVAAPGRWHPHHTTSTHLALRHPSKICAPKNHPDLCPLPWC
jgi:hypothetical protein